MQTSGDQRREKAKLYPPSLRAQRSNPPLRLPRYGLLRFARNDDLETSMIEPRSRGILDPPHSRERRPVLRRGPTGYEAASKLKTPASTRQRNSGDSGGGDSSGVQPVNFSSA